MEIFNVAIACESAKAWLNIRSTRRSDPRSTVVVDASTWSMSVVLSCANAASLWLHSSRNKLSWETPSLRNLILLRRSSRARPSSLVLISSNYFTIYCRHFSFVMSPFSLPAVWSRNLFERRPKMTFSTLDILAVREKWDTNGNIEVLLFEQISFSH